jgi:hypothetical protein
MMAYFDLIQKQQCWVLTSSGWFIVLISLIAIVILIAITIYPFLAMNRPLYGDILVVEGWIPDYLLEKAIVEFKTNNYQRLITTGGPLGKGAYLSEYKTYAELTATTLKKLGVSEEVIVSIPTPLVNTDRTYATAIAVKKWLLASNLSIKSLDIYSVGVHARRSRLLFNKALGDKVTVGVIAVESEAYDPQRWWKSSHGTRVIVGETIAYIYARFFFYPSPFEQDFTDYKD